MDKAVAKRDVVSPEEYTRNAAQIEQAKLYLAQLEAKNETGRQNFQEELMKKIQEGEQARQLLANMGQYNVTSNRPAIEFAASTARIEEIPSNTPPPPPQQRTYHSYAYQVPSANNHPQYSQTPSTPHYSYMAAASSNGHPVYPNEYLPSSTSSYSTTGAQYGPSYNQQAYTDYRYPTQAAGPTHIHHSSQQAPPQVSASLPRQPTHQHQETTQKTQSAPKQQGNRTPVPSKSMKANVAQPARQSARVSAKAATQLSSQPPVTSTPAPAAQSSNQTAGSGSSSTANSAPMHGRQSILEFRDAVYKWAGQAPPNAYIDVSGVRVLKDSSSMLYILTQHNGNIVKQSPPVFFEEMLARLASTGSQPPVNQPTTDQQRRASSDTIVPQAPAMSAKQTVNHSQAVVPSTLISGPAPNTTSSNSIPSGQSGLVASPAPRQSANIQAPTPTPQPPNSKPVSAQLPISTPRPTPLPSTTASNSVPRSQTTPPLDQSISIPVTPGLAQRQRTFVNGSWRSPKDANKSRLAKDLLTALGKRKPNPNGLSVEQPPKRPALEPKRVDFTQQLKTGPAPFKITTFPVTSLSTPGFPNVPASSTNVPASPDTTVTPISKVVAPIIIQIPPGPMEPPRPPQPSQHLPAHSFEPYQPPPQDVPVPPRPSTSAAIVQVTMTDNVNPVGQPAYGVLQSSEGSNPYASLLTSRKVHEKVDTPEFVQGASKDEKAENSSVPAEAKGTLPAPSSAQEANDKQTALVEAPAPSTETATDTTKKTSWQTVVSSWSKDAKKEPSVNQGVGNTAAASGTIQLLEPVFKTTIRNKSTPEQQQHPKAGLKTHQNVIDLCSPKVTPPPRASSPNDATEPLFLPSPASSVGVPPSSKVSASSVPIIIDKGKDSEPEPDAVVVEGATKTSKVANKKKSTNIYVLVPTAPKYLNDYREWEAKRAGKITRKEQQSEQQSSRPSSAVESRAQSVVMSTDVARMDESEDFSYANSNAVEPDEQKAIDLSCSRLQKAPCRWAGCNIVLNSADALARHLNVQHKPEPVADRDQTFICKWTQCGRQSRVRDRHVEKHASLPLVCAFKDCEDTFRSGGPLLRHFRKQHTKSDLKPAAVPFDRSLLAPSTGLPYQPLPANMFVTAPVSPKKITPERHQTIGPWIVRNIMASDQDTIRKPKRSKKTARAANRTDPYPGAGPSNDYEYLTTRTVRYSSYQSEAVNLKVQNLDSAKISEEFDQGLTLWAPENHGVSQSIDHSDADMPPDDSRPLSQGADGDSSRLAENDEEMVEDMLVRTNSPEL